MRQSRLRKYRALLKPRAKSLPLVPLSTSINYSNHYQPIIYIYIYIYHYISLSTIIIIHSQAFSPTGKHQSTDSTQGGKSADETLPGAGDLCEKYRAGGEAKPPSHLQIRAAPASKRYTCTHDEVMHMHLFIYKLRSGIKRLQYIFRICIYIYIYM